MSPEQAAGKIDELGPASDVYSLGAILYCLLTGQPPFTSQELGDILDGARRGTFPRPRLVNAAVAPALEAICLKAMSLRPADRYASATELGQDVERWLDDQPVAAWPEPWDVRLRRWSKQHRTLVTASAAAAVVAACSLGIATLLLTAANEELSRANRAEQAAKAVAEEEARAALRQKEIADEARDRGRAVELPRPSPSRVDGHPDG